MGRNKTTRLFGAPASVSGDIEQEGTSRFIIKMEGDGSKKIEYNDIEAPEIKLVGFAKSEYARKLATDKNADKFLEYCLENIYHTNIKEIVSKSRTVVDGWHEMDWYVIAEGIVVVGALAVVELVFDDEPDPDIGPEPTDIGKAAYLCGGKTFKDQVVNRLIELVKAEVQYGVETNEWAK